ncbi:MAG: phage head closure protein [Desulfosporosinus sp.]
MIYARQRNRRIVIQQLGDSNNFVSPLSFLDFYKFAPLFDPLPITEGDQVDTYDTSGAPVENWFNYLAVWASKQHKTSREFYAAQKVNAEITDLFIIRFNSTITTQMRVIYDGKYYDILGADDPDGYRRETHLLCKVVE